MAQAINVLERYRDGRGRIGVARVVVHGKIRTMEASFFWLASRALSR